MIPSIAQFVVAAATAIAVMGQLYHMERRRLLIEPDAALIVILVLGALTTVYWLH